MNHHKDKNRAQRKKRRGRPWHTPSRIKPSVPQGENFSPPSLQYYQRRHRDLLLEGRPPEEAENIARQETRRIEAGVPLTVEVGIVDIVLEQFRVSEIARRLGK
jgi:hypothetical protein